MAKKKTAKKKVASGRGVRSGTRRAAILEAIRTAPGIGLGEPSAWPA